MAIVISITNCKKAYDPPAISAPNNYLVVEGAIDPGADSTIIRLSNTVNLASAIGSVPVLGAQVLVVSNSGVSYPVAESGKGYYKALLNLNNSATYQLKIAAAGQSYASDLVPVKNAPVIDTMGYAIAPTGVEINLNTHDVTNNSRYYRWSFTETYLFHSLYYSHFEVVHIPQDTIIVRPLADQIYECWLTDTSTTIILGSSAKLAQDVIATQPITFIASNSEKVEDLYSILVKQYVLTPDAFNYYQQLQKNTEELGSIFDAQPSQLTGNIHCTSNSAQIAIGYITAGSYSQKRFFLDSRSLPNWIPAPPEQGCAGISALFSFNPNGSTNPVNQVAENIYKGPYIPVDAIVGGAPFYPIIGYTASLPLCVDCTVRGTNIKPSFWP